MNAPFNQEAKLFPSLVEHKNQPVNIKFTIKVEFLLMCSFIACASLLGFSS